MLRFMKKGTKSVLFGVHCFFIHPFFVAWAWTRLYGFPFDIRLWVAFFVHDLGYWGCDNMDDEKGEMHPYLGARIMHRLFDKKNLAYNQAEADEEFTWHNFTLYHSRFLAKKNNARFSRLCVADKLAIILTPKWLYLFLANISGEIHEYIRDFYKTTNGLIPQHISSQSKWKDAADYYLKIWVDEHRNMKDDLWTPDNRHKL